MCGIFGWITRGREVERNRVKEATQRMRHRGPDDEGYLLGRLSTKETRLAAGDETSGGLNHPSFQNPDLLPGADLAFGFRRLSIHDLSELGHQPMGNPDQSVWIVFNGEVYNFPELRQELEVEGLRFRSGTDTEVVLRAYERWGEDCLHRFNGMFALAILDLREGEPKLFFARDRAGVKPFFYTEDGKGGLAFASEMKSLLATMDRWDLDDIQISNFLAWGRNPSPRDGITMIKQVRTLPPGCKATLRDGKFQITRWWDLPADGDGFSGDEKESVSSTRDLLEDAVKIRLRADVPVGSCLSGGLDSSLIVGIINRLRDPAAPAQHTFSAVYDSEGPYNEKRFIDRVHGSIDATGHFTIPNGDWLVRDFEKLVWHQEEPFGSTSIFAQWCVMSLTKEAGITVLLDGQAADELFAGYRPWRWHFSDTLKREGIFSAISAMQSAERETGDRVSKEFAAALATAWLPSPFIRQIFKTGYKHALRRSADTLLRSEQIEPLVDKILDPESTESYPWRRVTDDTDSHLRGLVSDFCLPHLLRYEDRNSMAFSVEARVPFTDYRIMERAFSPSSRRLKIHQGWPKWILREGGKGLVPDDILWRKDKMGFGTPEATLIASLIRDRKNRIGGKLWRYIDESRASEVFRNALSPTATQKDALRALRILCLDSWLRQFSS